MKMKHVAAAALAACAAATTMPAIASIGTGALDNSSANNAELVFVVFDEGKSYTKDLGITLAQFLANPSSPFSIGLSGANFASYLAADTNLFDGTKFDGTRWGVFAVNNEPFLFNDGRVLLTTLYGGPSPQNPTGINNFDWFAGVDVLGAKFNDLSQVMAANGTANLQVATNGDSYTPVGTQGYFNDGGLATLGFSYYVTNAVGVSSAVYLDMESSDTPQPPISATQLAGRFLFDGTQLTYTVAAVPEPGSMALLFAGMGALGFVSRRRRGDKS